MKKILLCIVVFMFFVPALSLASEEQTQGLKAAFIKNGNLWLKIGGIEERITNGNYVRYPKWSYDGNWLAYLKTEKNVNLPVYDGELWLYNLQSGKEFKVYPNIKWNFQWAPDQHKIGFQSAIDKSNAGFHSKDRLYMADVRSLNSVHLISSEIANFSWLPNGQGFVTSSKAGEQIDSDIVISKMLLNQNEKTHRTKQLFTISVAKDEFFVTTSSFKWSDDQQWVTFLLNPTASLSADSNTLCILSRDGKVFKKIDDMLDYEEWFQWAPTKPVLSFISGGGREAIGNKQLKIFNPLQHIDKVFTPTGFVDRDFTWVNDDQLITSRSVEREWDDFEQRPLPSLYKVNSKTNEQSQLTLPLSNQGDFRPQYINGKIVWIRTDRQKADVWIANSDGTKESKWISNIDLGSWYYEKWRWDEVFSLYIS